MEIIRRMRQNKLRTNSTSDSNAQIIRKFSHDTLKHNDYFNERRYLIN